MLARAIGSTFHQPAMSASTSLLVPEEHLPRVQGLDSTLAGAVGIVSPPLGALLIRLLPLHGIMALDVFSAAFAIIPLVFVHIPRPRRQASPGKGERAKPSVWVDVREGVRFVWRWPGLRTLVLLPPLLKITLMPALSLLPLLATRHFGGDAAQIAWLNSAWGIGMMVGGLTLSAWAGFRRRSVTSMMGVTGLGLGMLIAGLAPSTAFWMAAGGMFVTGFMIPMADGPLMAILQTIVPPEMQGRVFTVVMSACNITTPIGMVIAGPVADRLGIPFYFVAAGVGSLATVLLALLSPSVMHIEENHRQEEAAATPAQAGAGAG
jgi:DHA3 family macrolide efflux protein-like MFS transporter